MLRLGDKPAAFAQWGTRRVVLSQANQIMSRRKASGVVLAFPIERGRFQSLRDVVADAGFLRSGWPVEILGIHGANICHEDYPTV